MNSSMYDAEFYERQVLGSARSATIVAGIIREIFSVSSVVDFGCGMGGWLKAFQENGAETVRGYDGDYVDRSQLLIDPEHFRAVDLTQEVELERRYDLAISLEVAEHLPRAAAGRFVATLVTASDVVLFSAAVPFQGGVEHVNEQWQSYWAKAFADHGYVMLDVIRPRLWSLSDVPYWYAQNALIYAAPAALTAHPSLARVGPGPGFPIDIVHPRAYAAMVDPERISVRRAGRTFGHAILRKLGKCGGLF